MNIELSVKYADPFRSVHSTSDTRRVVSSKILSKSVMERNRNIIHRPKTTSLYDNAQSLGHIIIDSLTNAGDKTVIVCGLTGRKLLANELLYESIRISKALLAAGIKRGDIVSVISESCFDYVFVLFGTLFINCTLAPLNHTYSSGELRHALNFSKPKFIFTGGSSVESVIEIAKTLSYVKKIICFDDRLTNDLTVNLSDFASSKTVQTVEFEATPADVLTTSCLIMCSSGTTGLPKGVQLSQSGVIATASNMKEFLFNRSNVGDDEEIVILGLLPLFHVFGSMVLISTMANQSGTVVLLPKFEEESFLRTLEKYRCSVAFLVPPLLVFLAKNQRVDQYDLSGLRLIICGAAPTSKELERSVKDRLNTNLAIKQLYGMTELTSVVLMQKEILKPGSVGDVNENVYAKVVDENGSALGPHQNGELCFKGTLVMMGYIGDKHATNAIIDEDGWLHTGDVGFYDDDLQFFIVDRIKELIKWKGYQVPPAGLRKYFSNSPPMFVLKHSVLRNRSCAVDASAN